MINGKLSILSTNVTGIKISEKRLKIFEYFRNLSAPAGFVFLQEPHSLVDVKKKKKKKKLEQFSRTILLFTLKNKFLWSSHRLLWKKYFELLKKFNDKSGCILIIEVKIENQLLLLINLYNANMGNEQLSMLSDLSNMLEKTDIINKSIAFGGDLNLFFEAKLEG